MRVYVTGRGVRCSRRRYQKAAGLDRQEAKFFKRSGTLDLPKATAEFLISKGWASADKDHPQVDGRGQHAPEFIPEPIELETQVIEPEQVSFVGASVVSDISEGGEPIKTDEEAPEEPLEEPPEGSVVETDPSAEKEAE